MNSTITGVKPALKPMVFELAIDLPPPPFVLLLNPNSLEIRLTPKVSESRRRWIDRRDSGYILQAHHDDLDVLTADGRSAQFYNDGGLTSENRQESIAWDNIEKLVAIYRNNGKNFNKNPNRKSTGVITSVGSVSIYYDSKVYIGSFNSFNVTESQDQQFSVNFNFEFKVYETRSSLTTNIGIPSIFSDNLFTSKL
jgi:hypothetical protein